jgi:MFS family permease
MSLTTKYYLITALSNAYFPLAIWTLYFVERWDFTYTQTVLIFVATLTTSTLLDLFGGVHADVIGRKKSAMIGFALELVGIVSIIFVENFFILIGFALLTGLGWAMISGSLDALVADELGPNSDEYKQANARVQMYLFLSRVVASVVGGWLYMQDVRAPYIAYGLVVLGALYIASTLHESRLTEKLKTHGLLFKELCIEVSSSKTILRICIGLLLGALASDLIWVYYQPFYSNVGLSALWLGILFAGISLLSAWGSWLVSKFYNVLIPQRIFQLYAIATAINGILFYLAI